MLARLLYGCIALSLSTTAEAKLQVVTTTTDLAWAAEQVGGGLVEVKPLLDGSENAHYVDAVPEFIRLVANADVVCIVGLDLEIGWMPKVLSKSGNAKVQPGAAGYCDASREVEALERPAHSVDRSMGHIHPSGNPHYWLSPKHLSRAARQMATIFAKLDVAHALTYEENLQALEKRLLTLEAKLKQELAAVFGGEGRPTVLQYHSDFVYFFDSYNIRSIGSLEEKPGVPPSAGRIATVALAAKKAGVKVLIALDTDPKKTLDKFAELSGIPVVRLPGSIRPAAGLKNYEALQAHYVDSLKQALR